MSAEVPMIRRSRVGQRWYLVLRDTDGELLKTAYATWRDAIDALAEWYRETAS